MPLAANPDQPATQNVHVQGYVHTYSNFNDYMQTALLTANLVTQQETNNLLAQAATERKLAWWKSVVLNRFPGITDPMQIEDSAKALMAWDARETFANNQRYQKAHLPWKQTWGETFIRSVMITVAGLITIPLLWFPTIIVASMLSLNTNKAVNYMAVAIICIAGYMIFWQIQNSSKWTPPSYRPEKGSELCRRFPPGSKIRNIQGEEFTVADWPVYQAERLRFWYPVDRHTQYTTVNTDDGKPWLQSDVILWNDGSNGPIPGRSW